MRVFYSLLMSIIVGYSIDWRSRLGSLFSSHIFISVYPGSGAVCYRNSSSRCIFLPLKRCCHSCTRMIVSVIYWKLGDG